jgi:hypothetical protein
MKDVNGSTGLHKFHLCLWESYGLYENFKAEYSAHKIIAEIVLQEA